MQVSRGRPHMLTSNQRGRGNDPVVVLGRIRLAVAVNMSPSGERSFSIRKHCGTAGSSLRAQNHMNCRTPPRLPPVLLGVVTFAITYFTQLGSACAVAGADFATVSGLKTSTSDITFNPLRNASSLAFVLTSISTVCPGN